MSQFICVRLTLVRTESVMDPDATMSSDDGFGDGDVRAAAAGGAARPQATPLHGLHPRDEAAARAAAEALSHITDRYGFGGQFFFLCWVSNLIVRTVASREVACPQASLKMI